MQKQNLIYHPELLPNVGPYLSMKDLLVSATTSKEYMYLMKQYLQKRFLPNANTTKENIFKEIEKELNRTIKIINKNQTITKNLNNLIIDHVQMQMNYLILETIEKKFYIARKDKTGISDLKPIDDRFTMVRVTDSNGLYCYDGYKLYRYVISEDEPISILLKQPNAEKSLLNEDFTEINGDLVNIMCSAKYSLLFIRELPDQLTLKVIYHDQPLTKTLQLKTISNIYNMPESSQIAISRYNIYLIQNQKLYTFDLKSGEAKIVEDYCNKKVVQVHAGRNHVIVAERKEETAENWTTEDVIKFAHREGLQDYINVFKSEKITGKKLLGMDKTYMQEVLGLQNFKLQQKMTIRLEQANKEKPENYYLTGWGISSKGQLGMKINKETTKPIKIKILQGCAIYQCIGYQTFIKNVSNGEIYYNFIQNGQIEWKNLKENDENFNVKEIAIDKSQIVVLAKNYTKKPPIKHQHKQKKEKFRTAKNVTDQIKWDPNLKNHQFKIGYTDKYDGLLEMTFEDYEISQVREYSLNYFKMDGQIVWDKSKRIDLL